MIVYISLLFLHIFSELENFFCGTQKLLCLAKDKFVDKANPTCDLEIERKRKEVPF